MDYARFVEEGQMGKNQKSEKQRWQTDRGKTNEYIVKASGEDFMNFINFKYFNKLLELLQIREHSCEATNLFFMDMLNPFQFYLTSKYLNY